MLGLKLIHVSKRGQWRFGSYCYVDQMVAILKLKNTGFSDKQNKLLRQNDDRYASDYSQWTVSLNGILIIYQHFLFKSKHLTVQGHR